VERLSIRQVVNIFLRVVQEIEDWIASRCPQPLRFIWVVMERVQDKDTNAYRTGDGEQTVQLELMMLIYCTRGFYGGQGSFYG